MQRFQSIGYVLTSTLHVNIEDHDPRVVKAEKMVQSRVHVYETLHRAPSSTLAGKYVK